MYHGHRGIQKYVEIVPTYELKNGAEVNQYHGIFVSQGYEGSIIRSGGGEPYNFQYRDNQLQKNKDFDDAEFVIVGCKEGTGIAEGMAIFKCQSQSVTGGVNGDGTFDVVVKCTHAERQKQWKNRAKYIGLLLTVRYQCLSDDGIPIFPVGIAVRDYE